tara:strand:+ start:28 stop:621 length:594 start_codon:yes stop_codon:yes gene_type:complete
MKSGPDMRYPQWGCSGRNKAPCDSVPWCKYVKNKGCKKDTRYQAFPQSWKSSSRSSSFVDPNMGSRNIRKGATPCAIDTSLPQPRRKALCHSDPNCSWDGKHCKFIPKKTQGAAQYGSYQGPRNLLPNLRPTRKYNKEIQKKWKEAAKKSKKEEEKRKKLAQKLAKEAQKSRRKLPKRPTRNPFIDDEPLDPSNPFY